MLLHKRLRPYVSLLGHSQLRNLNNQHIGLLTGNYKDEAASSGMTLPKTVSLKCVSLFAINGGTETNTRTWYP